MNIFDNYLHASEMDVMGVRIPEGKVMRRSETHTPLRDTMSKSEFNRISCLETAISSSTGGQCRVSIATIEEPRYIVEEEMKTAFYFWIRDSEKLLLDRKCKA